MSKCKCFDEMLEKVTDNLKGQLPESESRTFESGWANESLVLEDSGVTAAIGVPVKYRYRKFKKSGEPYRNSTSDTVSIFMNYCPFCGDKIRGKGAEA